MQQVSQLLLSQKNIEPQHHKGIQQSDDANQNTKSEQMRFEDELSSANNAELKGDKKNNGATSPDDADKNEESLDIEKIEVEDEIATQFSGETLPLLSMAINSPLENEVTPINENISQKDKSASVEIESKTAKDIIQLSKDMVDINNTDKTLVKEIIAQEKITTVKPNITNVEQQLDLKEIKAINKFKDVEALKNELVIKQDFKITSDVKMSAPLKKANLLVNFIEGDFNSIKEKIATENLTVSDVKFNQILLNQNPQTEAHRSETPQFQLSLKVNDQQNNLSQMMERFAPAMKQQLMTMVSQGIQQGEIKLDPPELGQMLVRIVVNGDQTQVHFNVSQQQTKDLVEQALPRLREMLAAQGMQLADGQVSQDGGAKQQNDNSNNPTGKSTFDLSTDETLTEGTLNVRRFQVEPDGIDFYA